jgi:acetate kinase
MKILTLDCSDASIKFAYFDTVQDTRNFQGVVDGIGKDHSTLAYRENGNAKSRAVGGLDHAQALDVIVGLLTGDGGVIGGLYDLDAIGHKVAHGGDRYGSAVIVDDQVLAHIEQCASFAPLHNPANLIGIRASLQLASKVPQVAIFDTGFHQKMPVQAYLDGLPYEFFEQDHLRRYGTHGIAHQYAALQAAAHLKRSFRELKIITCYLDDEASLCAIDHGRSVDTTAGLSPLGGLIMGTRSGDLDPSVVLHLMREKGLSVDQVQELLNQQSGLRGLSGISGDFRELEDAANRGDHRSIVAIQAFCYRVRKCIGSYVSAMGELDALVFTGHIAEGSAWVRSLACQGLSSMGIAIDEIKNKTIPPRPSEATAITEEGSQISVMVIPADEARMIARETVRALGYQNVARTIERQEKKEIPVEVSAHHVHLCEKDVEALFGPGYQLSRRSDLSQPGQFACEETVNLIGPRGRVDRVRILGPTRSQTQVEIAMTEEFKLGIKAPIRASGDLDGSPGITLEGPRRTIDLPRGVICSVRHIHMSPEDVLAFGLKDRDICMIRVEGERTLIFGDVLVRVNPDYRLAMHIDTDEANAASIRTGMLGYLVGVQDRR